MKAAVLVRKGNPRQAFEIQERPLPELHDQYVMIETEAFGLNYADVMARNGQYRDAPPMPSVIGYDVCGRVRAIGAAVEHLAVGDRVTALTRFGGYAQFAVTDARAAVKIPDNTDACTALALATQGATAWYCAEEVCRIYPHERVIITAAAGGVGSLLLQLAKRRHARVYGIVSTTRKEEIIMQLGAHGTLNRSRGDIFEQYRHAEGPRAIDIMFDSAGGSYTKNAMKNLAPGGRYVGYGGSQGSGVRNIFQLLRFGLSFGFYHPAPFLMKSQGLIGVNMLRMADHKPDVLKICLEKPLELFIAGELKPLQGETFGIGQLAEAHEALEQGKIPGKIAVKWN